MKEGGYFNENSVTYDNGEVFGHFGRTEFFKVYEVADNKVVSSEVISSNGTGHGALAGLLAGESVDVLICGGIGGGAQAALAEAGIELCAGATGDADQAVEDYLNGKHWCHPGQTAIIITVRNIPVGNTVRNIPRWSQ